MLSHKELNESCLQNGLYFCNDGYDNTRREVIEQNDEPLNDEEVKISTMSRMLSEYLDYREASEEDDEPLDDRHSEMMEYRYSLCDALAKKWVDGDYAKLPADQWLDAANKDLADMLKRDALGSLADEILEYFTAHWYDGEKITSKTLAEYLGKTKIIELHETSGAVTFDDFWNEVNTYFSGSVLDGSPFGAAEAEKYAKFTWDRYGDA
jgi:hypothetical protein